MNEHDEVVEVLKRFAQAGGMSTEKTILCEEHLPQGVQNLAREAVAVEGKRPLSQGHSAWPSVVEHATWGGAQIQGLPQGEALRTCSPHEETGQPVSCPLTASRT